MTTDTTPDNGDDMVRQVGIKIWVDGSPWIGNIDLSFPYLDTDATRTIGVTPGSCGHANYTREQLTEIVARLLPAGLADGLPRPGRRRRRHHPRRVRASAAAQHPRDDHRLRLEHVGAISDEQLQRAHDLGVTCSIFVDQIHYWGDVIVDGLFGPEHGARWMPCGSAVATGMRISLHNDPPVTPEEPLRNISVAATRTAPSGRVLGAGGAADGRAGHPRADHRRGVAAVRRRRHRLAGGRQVRRHGGAVGRSARRAARGDRRPRGAGDVPGGPAGLRRKTTDDAARHGTLGSCPTWLNPASSTNGWPTGPKPSPTARP